MLMKKYNVAICGATGAVGETMLKVLKERNFPVEKLKLFASYKSKGRKYKFLNQDIFVEELTKDSFKDTEIALFSIGAGLSKEFAPIAVENGATVIDNSSAFRMDKNVPLIIPEVNPEDVSWHNGIIANPNCSTLIMVVAINPIHKISRIKRIVTSTYQAVSGTGRKAIEELKKQSRAVLDGEKVTSKVYPVQIAFNVLPHIEDFYDNGYTKEEMKMVHETHKIMGDNSIRITATTVRVPVFTSHSLSVNLELESKLTKEEVRDILSKAPGLKVMDDPENLIYPTTLNSSGNDLVYVGRIREDDSVENGLNLWIVSDQLRKGAATNAIQIAEILIEKNLV
ncbi:MAG: aspartate-semialdehyde dehydrogenase [Actinomycetia bacterium]|nr:aspartate-semialdehyde dehydrogenase [Actinomycetes bacterium]